MKKTRGKISRFSVPLMPFLIQLQIRGDSWFNLISVVFFPADKFYSAAAAQDLTPRWALPGLPAQLALYNIAVPKVIWLAPLVKRMIWSIFAQKLHDRE